jgi:NusA-like KH domain protein
LVKLRLNADTLHQMKLFSDITKISCIDCFESNGTLIFITKKSEAGRAIGPQGKYIKILRSKTNKNIKIMEQAADSCGLIQNYLFPIKPKKCEIVDNVAQIEFNSSRERRLLLDNQLRGLKDLKFVVSRYHPDIKDIRIL